MLEPPTLKHLELIGQFMTLRRRCVVHLGCREPELGKFWGRGGHFWRAFHCMKVVFKIFEVTCCFDFGCDAWSVLAKSSDLSRHPFNLPIWNWTFRIQDQKWEQEYVQQWYCQYIIWPDVYHWTFLQVWHCEVQVLQHMQRLLRKAMKLPDLTRSMRLVVKCFPVLLHEGFQSVNGPSIPVFLLFFFDVFGWWFDECIISGVNPWQKSLTHWLGRPNVMAQEGKRSARTAVWCSLFVRSTEPRTTTIMRIPMLLSLKWLKQG